MVIETTAPLSNSSDPVTCDAISTGMRVPCNGSLVTMRSSRVRVATPDVLKKQTSLTGGVKGIILPPVVSPVAFLSDDQFFYFLCLVSAGVLFLLARNLLGDRTGRAWRAVRDGELAAAAFGVNVTVVYTVTFIIGAMLGALGGAVMAPKISVTLGIGVEVIVLAFAVVVTGGLGSIEGALTGALIVGLCRAAAVHLVPQIELFVIYAVMALVLVFRPYGLFTQAQPRKI